MDQEKRRRSIRKRNRFDEEDPYYLNYIPKRYERVESSKSKNKRFFCRICTDTKTMGDAFWISGCSHAYCSDCVARYIVSKLEDNITIIGCPCPGCSGFLEPGFCRPILLPEVFGRWTKAVSEDVIYVSDKFYCPFSDCGAFLICDGTESVRKLECPNCNRMLCAQCKVPWHAGMECSEFKKLNRDEKGKGVMLMHLAKDTKWRRCPKPSCRFYVAKSGGCNVMTCKCSCRFCYPCGGVLVTEKCNCYYKRNSYRPDPEPKQNLSMFKGGVYANGTFPNGRDNIYLANQLKNTLKSYQKLE